ncbi:MAG TPA: glycoside hydrolase family protein [Longimicrobiaceae bacterium]|nr:glycoside hydrolase family protein [Longimicrobiaceae bacterium]
MPAAFAIRPSTRAFIARHEGRRTHVYLDAKGHPTVGVGFNLDRDDARQMLAAVRADYDAVRGGRQTLTDAQVDALLDRSLAGAAETVRAAVPGFDAMKPAQQDALLDMAFNLGSGGFPKFQKMIAALNAGDMQKAAAEMEDSLWARQVGPQRVGDVVAAILA